MAVELRALQATVEKMKRRVHRVEEEASALRSDLDEIIALLAGASQPVARYVIDGEEIVVTETDVAAVQSRLTRPCSNEAAQELALADKLAAWLAQLPEGERRRRFRENIEAIRAEAIAKGIAVEDPREAAIYD